MKYFKYIILFMAVVPVIFSCKKNPIIPKSIPYSSLTVANALVGSSPLIADYYGAKYVGTYFATTPTINYGSASEYSIPAGNPPLVIYQTSDTVQAVYKNNISLQSLGIYSLFLCGTAASPDALITTDHPPYHPAADSTAGVRFINLSPGSSPVSVNIKGQANGSEVQSLAYKSITDFKNYPATADISSYAFEFRDAGTGAMLASYTISGVNNGTGTNTATNQYRWKNITIVLKGLPGVTAGPAAQGTFQVNNY